ncbi:hypothetical protein R80B4_01111 [Fibrobacteres bacterium R8-0-B4]
MGKTVVITSEEIRKEWTAEKLREWSKRQDSFPDDDPDPVTDEDIAAGRVRLIPGRGFAALKKYLNTREKPESEVKEDEPVPILLREDVNVAI